MSKELDQETEELLITLDEAQLAVVEDALKRGFDSGVECTLLAIETAAKLQPQINAAPLCEALRMMAPVVFKIPKQKACAAYIEESELMAKDNMH